MEMRNLICKAGTIKETAETNFCKIVVVFSDQITTAAWKGNIQQGFKSSG